MKHSFIHGLSSPPRAATVLDAVESWASGAYMLRETAALLDGRLDALMFPYTWEQYCPLRDRGLYGVEVKIHRSDFLRGLRENQFERYAAQVNALYIATGPGVCKTSEIPPQFGHLIVKRQGEQKDFVAVCRRRATYRECDIDVESMWRVVFDLMDQCQRDNRREREKYERATRQLGKVVGKQIVRIAKQIESQVT